MQEQDPRFNVKKGYSIILKTFMRPEKLEKCLQSMVSLTIPPKKIVVADDGGPSDEKSRVYKKYEKILPLQVIELDFDAGLSKGRNIAFQNTDTPFILLIDDDHYLSSNIFEIQEILDENPHIGGVSPFWEENGEIYSEAGDLKLGNWVVKRILEEKPLHRTSSGIGFYEFDFISNSCLFRRECLLDYSWDDFFIINGEHADFFLTHKKMGKWSFAVTPNYIVQHDPGSKSKEYLKHRKSKAKKIKSMKYLAKKHNIKGFIYDGSIVTKKKSTYTKVKQFFARRILPHKLNRFKPEFFLILHLKPRDIN